jgi:hypothetical protein
MQFLIETVTPATAAAGADREARQWALVPTLAEAHLIAAEACGDPNAALAELREAGLPPEGELAGDWGSVRFAPAC